MNKKYDLISQKFMLKPLAHLVPILSVSMLPSIAHSIETTLSTTQTSQQILGSNDTSFTITSSGVLSATDQTSLRVSGATNLTGGISNSGTISVNTTSPSWAPVLIFNGSTVGSFTNSGAITGLTAAINVVQPGTSVASFTNSSTGIITGNILFNTGTSFDTFDNFGQILSGPNTGGLIDFRGSHDGDFNNAANAVISNTNTGTGASGVSIIDGDFGGEFLNSGEISSSNGSAIKVSGSSIASISNAGTLSGGVYAIDISNTSTVGSVNNTGTINGDINFGANGGTYRTLGGSSGEIFNATRIELGAYGSAGFPNTNVSPSGAVISTINGNLNFTGDLAVDLMGSAMGVSYGQLNVTGNTNLVIDNLIFNVSGEDFIGDGEKLTVVSSQGALTASINSASDNSLLLAFNVAQEGNDIVATVATNDIEDVIKDIIEEQGADALLLGLEDFLGADLSSPGALNILGVADALNRIATLIESGEISEDSEIGQVIAGLQAVENPVELVQSVQTLEPESGGGSSAGATAVFSTVANVIATRLASIRGNQSITGMAAGDDIALTGFWVQGYDKDTEQDLREGIDGFDVDMYGVAIGADGPINENTTVGFAVSYADSEVNSKGFENNDLLIDSYQISTYVSYNDDDYYLDALVSYARNDYESDRHLFTGLTASVDYSGDQYGLRVRGGYPFVFESGLHITPNTAVEYSYLSEDSYKEEGAGNSGLDVDSQNLEALVLAAGLKFSYPFTTESDTTWMPDFHIEARHDFIADNVELDTNFVGVGGAGFSINGASVEATSYKAGLGLRVWSQSALSFSFRYDYLYKKDYDSQSLAATVRYSF